MSKIKTLAELCEKSFKVDGLIPIEYWFDEPGHYANCVAPFYPEEYLRNRNNQKFNTKNRIVAFVYRNVLHVIPQSQDVMDILVNERFVHQVAIAVPFADGSKPFYIPQREKWDNMLREAGMI